MADPQRSLGLSRSKTSNTSSSSTASSSSSSSRGHVPPGPPQAGGRRAKTPLRARNIINAMDKGFEKSRERVEAEKRERANAFTADEESEDGCEDGPRGVQQEEATSDAVDTAVPPQKAGARLPGAIDDQRASKLLKCCDGRRRYASSKPRQAYLTSALPEAIPISEKEDGTSSTNESASSSSSSSSDLQRKLSAIPRVPLFSSASKREIQSLTSRKALQDEKNPITHSTVGAGTLHYNSSSTGHQVANRVGVANDSSPEGWWHTRMRKLRDQAGSEEKQSDLFQGLSIYINGYAGSKIGNKELQRLLSLNGAEVHYLPNGRTTHIVSEMALSAKKTQEMLQLRAGRVKKFVKVDWILDSLLAGKRRPEHPYAHAIPVQRGIAQMLGSHSSGKATTPGVAPAPAPAPASASSGDGTGNLKATAGSGITGMLSQDWREAARGAAALAAATRTDRQKRCS